MKIDISSHLVEVFPSLATVIFDLPVWYWLFTFMALAVAWIAARFLRAPLSHCLAFCFRQRDADKSLFIKSLEGPISFLITLLLFLMLSFFIKEPGPEDGQISIAIRLAVFLWLTYLFYRLIDLSFSRLIRNNLGPRSRVALILPLGRRMAKTLLLITAFLLILSQFGVDVSAFLVGLGVGSLAIALAAQKILENLFGGAVLSLDQPFQVGDYVKCGDILGHIEEIGIRSTRIRTLDRTLISIPNSKLSEMNIENYMEREKIRLYVTWRLDLSTTTARIKELLAEMERLLLQNDNFYPDSYRFRLIGVSDLGYEIEILAHAKTTEVGEFSAMREDLFFSYIEKMEELGLAFALPGRFTVLQRASGNHLDGD